MLRASVGYCAQIVNEFIVENADWRQVMYMVEWCRRKNKPKSWFVRYVRRSTSYAQPDIPSVQRQTGYCRRLHDPISAVCVNCPFGDFQTGEKYHEKNDNHLFDFINMYFIVCLQQNRKQWKQWRQPKPKRYCCFAWSIGGWNVRRNFLRNIRRGFGGSLKRAGLCLEYIRSGNQDNG